jgi:hypothetical protein
MKLAKLSRVCDSAKVQDMAPEEQTDKVKKELYDLTLQFVRKYWRQYYPQFKGDINDLASDYYLDFLTPKSREKGKEQSLLDKFDPKVTSLPYLVKVAVQRKLIDGSRTDKGEKNYEETYDEETGDLSLDYIANAPEEDDLQIEDIEFSPADIAELKEKFANMGPKEKKAFLDYYSEVKGVLSQNFKDLFREVTGDIDFSKAEVSVTGKAPSYDLVIKVEGKVVVEKTIRAGNISSLVRKIQKEYPEIDEDQIMTDTESMMGMFNK